MTRTNPLFDNNQQADSRSKEEAAPGFKPSKPPHIVEGVCGEFGSNRTIRTLADLNNKVVIPLMKGRK